MILTWLRSVIYQWKYTQGVPSSCVFLRRFSSELQLASKLKMTLHTFSSWLANNKIVHYLHPLVWGINQNVLQGCSFWLLWVNALRGSNLIDTGIVIWYLNGRGHGTGHARRWLPTAMLCAEVSPVLSKYDTRNEHCLGHSHLATWGHHEYNSFTFRLKAALITVSESMSESTMPSWSFYSFLQEFDPFRGGFWLLFQA